MDNVIRAKFSVPLLLLLAVLVAAPAAAQATAYPNDISGHWITLFHEDNPERGTGPSLGEYQGMPINEDARAHAMSWDASIQGLPEWRCRPHNPDYAVRSPQYAQIWAVWDDIARDVREWHIALERTASDRVIYMDGRPHPSANAAALVGSGFSTGEWIGDVLKVTTTHLKEGYARRNGVYVSDKRTFTEYIIKRDNGYLSWVMIFNDPVYLTEPWIRSSEYRYDQFSRVDTAPCVEVEEETRAGGEGFGFVPALPAGSESVHQRVRHRVRDSHRSGHGRRGNDASGLPRQDGDDEEARRNAGQVAAALETILRSGA